MREIKFRGLRTDGKGWAYGTYCYRLSRHSIQTNQVSEFGSNPQVIPESVGQFTGLKDANINDIYEGDKDDNGRVMLWNEDMALFCWCYWNEYRNDYFPSSYPTYKNEQERVTITGNIHENN